MTDSEGNNFTTGDTLVSSECPDTGSGIVCKSIVGNLAYFEHKFDYNSLSPDSFCLNQESLDASKWIKQTS